MPIWTLTAAKTNLGEVIDRALTSGPQTITRRGRVTAVVVSAEDWKRKIGRLGSLVDFLAGSPLCGSGLDVERIRDRPPSADATDYSTT